MPTEYINLKRESAANNSFCASLLPAQTERWSLVVHMGCIKASHILGNLSRAQAKRGV